MKNFSLVLLLGLIAISANAALKHAPFQPEVDKRFNVLELQTLPLADTIDGQGIAHKYARATYDTAISGVSSVNSISLGASLPAKAIVTKVLIYTDTQFTQSGTGSLQMECGPTSNLLASTTITSWAAGAVHLGVPVPSTPTISEVGSAACTIQVRSNSCVGCGTPTAGKLEAFIEYFIKN